jgi:single-stranded DNA-binding protein
LVSYLTKGKALSIGGDFNTGTMTDKSGTVRITHNMVCDYINFVNIGGNNGNKSENTNTQTPQASTTVAPDEEISMGKVPVSVGAPTSTPITAANSDEDELPF